MPPSMLRLHFPKKKFSNSLDHISSICSMIFLRNTTFPYYSLYFISPKKMMKRSVALSDFVGEEGKTHYLNVMAQWTNLVNTEARKLFSNGNKSVTDAELAIDVDLFFLLTPFRENSVLSQSTVVQFLLALLKEGAYSGLTRSFFSQLCKLFNISYRDFTFSLEYPISRDMILSARNSKDPGISAQRELEERDKKSRFKRWAWTSLGAIGGGVALAVSGGLAAPLILPYMGSVLGASTLLAGASGVAVVTSIFGATGAGLAGYRFSRRTGSLKDFSFLPIDPPKSCPDSKPLHATICISGWITCKEDITEPWSSLEDGEVFAVQFEAETLLTIGQALTNLFATQVVGYAASEVLKKTVMAGLIAAVAWPFALLQAGAIIDNPWSIGLDRADKAGRVMADALINRAQGNRPVTLVGFSLGGRVIFSCLNELLAKSETDPSLFHLIENAIILGAPVTTSRKSWMGMKSLVPGRLINGYVSEDWVLSFLHRTYNYGRPVAGNANLHMLWSSGDYPSDVSQESHSLKSPCLEAPDEGIDSPALEFDSTGANDLGVESVDLSGIVDGHLDYVKALPTILAYLGFATTSDQESQIHLSSPSVLFETNIDV
ncbi:Transmembrane and coiled-coil domain-containing protein 4 [Entomophthora muscae]|uniref:Transmembrane and coiled-coil domain-containing protein 4 n=1 Tax=Entomophthora muscae TaxID=34485 RepID=A0ACC2TK82_9FUNG|nr:Transmembrane and coiled-coil domain-containing protein 4 [Entomophthora muscae]